MSISEIKYQTLKVNFFLTCELSVILFILSIPYMFLLWKMSTVLLALVIITYKMGWYNMIADICYFISQGSPQKKEPIGYVYVYTERERF